MAHRVVWIGCAALRDEVISAIDLVVPGTAVPVVVTREVEYARSLHIECDVEVVGLLIKEVARIGPFVAAGAVVGAAHVGVRPMRR